MSDVDPGQWTEFLRDVHIEDIGTTALELARVEPDLATGLVAVLTPMEGDEDTGRRPCLLHVSCRHVDDVRHTCWGHGQVLGLSSTGQPDIIPTHR